MFVCELSSCGFESRYCHLWQKCLDFYKAEEKQGFAWWGSFENCLFMEFEPTPQGIDWGMFDELAQNLVEPKLTYARLSDNLVLPKINGSQSRKTSVLMY